MRLQLENVRKGPFEVSLARGATNAKGDHSPTWSTGGDWARSSGDEVRPSAVIGVVELESGWMRRLCDAPATVCDGHGLCAP